MAVENAQPVPCVLVEEQPLRPECLHILAFHAQQVNRLFQMAARDHHGLGPGNVQSLGRQFHVVFTRDRDSGQRFRLVHIRRHNRGQWQKPCLQNRHSSFVQHCGTGRGLENGIQNHVRQRGSLQEPGQALGDLPGPEHPDVHSRNTQVGSQFLQSRHEEPGINRGYLPHSCGGLNGHRRNRRHSIAAVGGDRLDVGRNPGARRRVKTGDRQHHGRSLRHSWNLSETATSAKIFVSVPRTNQPFELDLSNHHAVNI